MDFKEFFQNFWTLNWVRKERYADPPIRYDPDRFLAWTIRSADPRFKTMVAEDISPTMWPRNVSAVYSNARAGANLLVNIYTH